ncbi:MAG: TIGR03013 family PEP-CTERM/XrtA system glycosyltransferase [Pseudomonadales bacterium]
MGTVRLFKHHLHTAFVWLAVLEGLLFVVSVFIGAYLRFQGDTVYAEESIGPVLPRALIFAAVAFISMGAMGLYQPHTREGLSGIWIRAVGAFAFMAVGLSLIFYLFPELLLGRGALALTAVVAFLFVGLTRFCFHRLVDQEKLKRGVLVYGAGHRAQLVLSRLRRKSDRQGFRFIGFVPVGNEEEVVDQKLLVRLENSIHEYAANNPVDEILVAVDDRRKGLPVEDLLECKLSGTDVLDVVDFFEREAGKIMLEFVTAGWMVFSDGFNSGIVRATTKRLFDICASFVLLMATWPMMLLTVIAIWLEEGVRAPIVYRQERVGLNGKTFQVLKFRSMRIDAERDGKAVWAKKNDSRITRVGSFIRRCRVDELPQIINVLKGDMAFVGPRPERPEFVDQLSRRIPHYAARHQVKPGIAGWAQLNYPYGANDEDARQKLQFDLYYVKNHSMFLDLLILVQTVEVVLFGKGVR